MAEGRDGAQEARCLNCGEAFTAARPNFCPGCGQRSDTGRLRTRDTFFVAVSHLFQLDSQILRTVVGLTRQPGQVCADYVRGMRVRYVAPLKYLLVAVALVLVANAVSGFDPMELAPSADQERAQEVQRVVSSFALQHLDLAMLLALPFFIAVVRLLFRRSGHTYAEVSVFVLYLLGHTLLLGLLFVPLRSFSPVLGVLPKLLLQLTLFSWASVRFFRVPVLSSVLRNVLAQAVYMLLLSLSIVALTLPRILAIIRD